jgi:hypothetical protein
MKPYRLHWWPYLILVVSFSQAFPQGITALNSGSGGPADISEIAHSMAAPLETATATDDQVSSPAPQTPPRVVERPYGWHIAIYPAMAWVPIFGASVTVPPFPSQPIAPSQTGSTNSSFNGAYFGGARVEKGKWAVDALFMWADLSAERTTPHTSVSLDFVFGDLFVGREVLPNLYLEGGFRRLALDINATVGTVNATASPGYWDPLVGLTYARPLGKKWRILVHGDGGGFGVGSDVDVAASGRAEWQFVRHAGITMGYGGLHLSNSTTIPRGTLTVSPTMHGPIFGLGVYF